MLLLFSVVLTIVFYAAAPTLLRLFGASDTTLPYALAYSRIYILGTICVLIVLGMNTFITAQGFAKISMLTTVSARSSTSCWTPSSSLGWAWA